jgi:hypothetical protein
MLSWWLNLAGLLLATAAACLMYFFPPSTRRYSADGGALGEWESDQGEAGRRAFKRQDRMTGFGVTVLGGGFALQALAAIIGRYLKPISTTSSPIATGVDTSIWAHWLQTLTTNADFWNAFWAAVFGAATGAILAFRLERNRREKERIRHELGQCHTLVYSLIHMLTVLEDFREQLFMKKAEELHRLPKWHEIGGLEGAPERGPGFAVKDYVFLLDRPDGGDKASELLNNIYIAAGNFDAILGRINLRTRLWHEFLVHRAARAFARGEDALPGIAQFGATSRRIQELTVWIADDISESITAFRGLFSQVYAVFRARYPKESFIYPQPVRPTVDPSGPLVDQSP